MNRAVRIVMSCLALHIVAAHVLGQTAPKTPETTVSPTQRVAVVNIVDLFDHLKEKIAADKELMVLKQQADAASAKLQNDVHDLQAKLSALDEGDPQRKQVQEALATATAAVKNAADVAQAQFVVEMRVRTISLYKKINEAVATYAEANNIDLVLVADDLRLNNGASQEQLQMTITTRKVLYSRKTIDITKEVEQRMNADYDAGQGQRP